MSANSLPSVPTTSIHHLSTNSWPIVGTGNYIIIYFFNLCRWNMIFLVIICAVAIVGVKDYSCVPSVDCIKP